MFSMFRHIKSRILYLGGVKMIERGNTIEFPKEFLKRIKLISILENKKIRNFCMEILDKILKEYEEKYGLNKKK